MSLVEVIDHQRTKAPGEVAVLFATLEESFLVKYERVHEHVHWTSERLQALDTLQRASVGMVRSKVRHELVAKVTK